ncbi:MAG: SAM-dependent methyltransferase [Verrucomicrobia bacterium]|nr:MAG: SAM-dependent methyltransferase [Verrucomicrobiota bacterium]
MLISKDGSRWNLESRMETHFEVDRLKDVYRQYGERGWGKKKWAVTNRGNQAIQQERDRKLEQLLQRAGFLPLGNRRILDVGCGTGEILAGFEAWGARPENLFGVDLLAERIRRAKDNFPEMTFQEANAEALPFANGFFDLVALFTVFTSIRDHQMARNVSREINRILRSGGAVVWYDFRMNNPFNPHVRGISRKGVRRLFPEYDSRLMTVTLLPPLARRAGCLTDLLYPWLASLLFLRSHYLGVLIKS